MSDKHYPQQFNTEAVKQIVDRYHCVAEVVKRLDITANANMIPKSCYHQ